MKKAIIDPRQQASAIVGRDAQNNPIVQVIPNSARVAEVTDAEFPVAEPLFWIDCADDVVADQWYYDTVQAACFIVPTTPPIYEQPTVVGAQAL